MVGTATCRSVVLLAALGACAGVSEQPRYDHSKLKTEPKIDPDYMKYAKAHENMAKDRRPKEQIWAEAVRNIDGGGVAPTFSATNDPQHAKRKNLPKLKIQNSKGGKLVTISVDAYPDNTAWKGQPPHSVEAVRPFHIPFVLCRPLQ
jgi:hypothetical protein